MHLDKLIKNLTTVRIPSVTLKYGLIDTVQIPPLGFSPSLLDVA